MQLKNLGEIDLLKQIRQYNGVSNIGDDCAVLDYTDDKYQLVSTDMLVEAVHFSPQTMSWLDIGRKAVEVNLSDIAAMGGLPTQLFLSLGLPADFELDNLKALYHGLAAAQVPISGGDLVTSAKVVINICVLGEVEKGLVLRRSGAQLGDLIAVTGPLGGNAASDYTLVPTAKVKEGQLLAKSGIVTALTDISDGLARSIYDISTESKVGIKYNEKEIPLSPHATLDQALNGGEDYELLFTFKAGSNLPIKATIIGQVVSAHEGTELKQKGYQHYG